MLLTDLVQIGKLGKFINDDGFINLKVTREFKENYLRFPDIFLVFKDDRVRLVTLENVSTERGFKLRFKELDIVEEGIRTGDIRVMLPREDIRDVDQDSNEISFLGNDIYYSGKIIARVVDVFFNNVYNIFVCEMQDGTEFMIPDVDYYVCEKISGKLKVRNIEELIGL